MAEHLLDASALLASLLEEPGADRVDAVLNSSAVTSVNVAEVLTKIAKKGADPVRAWMYIQSLNLPILPFTAAEVEAGIRFAPLAWTHGFSLGDRVCLATAYVHKRIVVTADRHWAATPGVKILLIRD